MDQTRDPRIPEQEPQAAGPDPGRASRGQIPVNKYFSLGDDGPGFDPATDFEDFPMACQVQLPSAGQEEAQPSGQEYWNRNEVQLTTTDGLGDRDEQKAYRSKRKAEQAGVITDVPENLAIPTRTPYHNTLTTVQNPFGYIQPILESALNKLEVRNGIVYLNGTDVSHRDLSFLYDRRSKTLNDLDLPVLRAIYSTVLNDFNKTLANLPPEYVMKLVGDRQFLSRNVAIGVPELMKAMGHEANLNSGDSIYVIAKLSSYHHALGVTDSAKVPTNYAVLDYVGYNSETNSVVFTCPYLNWMIITLFKAGMRRNGKNEIQRTRNGKALTDATYSYLIHTDIAGERNQKAVNLVCEIIRLIEQAGNGPKPPNIYAKNLVELVPDLDAAVEAGKTSSDRNKPLRRAFARAWELLRDKTDLECAYLDIRIPDVIPTYGNMKKLLLEFPHEGKASKEEKEAAIAAAKAAKAVKALEDKLKKARKKASEEKIRIMEADLAEARSAATAAKIASTELRARKAEEKARMAEAKLASARAKAAKDMTGDTDAKAAEAEEKAARARAWADKSRRLAEEAKAEAAA